MPMPFSSRLIARELLDDASAQDARGNLADLIRLNQTFGGHALILRMLGQLVQPGDAFTLLDVGAASGDSARVIQKAYPKAQVISMDLNARNLEAAPGPKLLGDAFHLPFRDGSVDL